MGRRCSRWPTRRQQSRAFKYRQGARAVQKGRENEARVGQALEILQEGGYITDYFVSKPNGTWDQNGVDACLTTPQEKKIRFQIKSSYWHAQRHKQKHPDIPCLVVSRDMFSLDIAKLIRDQFALSRKRTA